MSTKQQSSINYDPGAMSTYRSLQSPLASVLTQYMKNPLQSTFFNQNVGMGQRQISGMNSAAMQGLMSNMRASGMNSGATSPFAQSMIRQQGRANAGMQANNFLQNLNMSRQAQQWATGMAQSYSPLMTGQTTTTSGTGTWLPQLIGAGIGAAGMAMTGGASAGLGGLSGMTKAVNSLPIGTSAGFGALSGLVPQVGGPSGFGGTSVPYGMLGGF